MRGRFITVMSISLSVLITGAVVGQESSTPSKGNPEWIASLYLDVSVPLGNFANIISENSGIGIGGEILYNVQYASPVYAGLGVHSFEFDDSSLRYTDVLAGEFVEFDEKTASRTFMAHAIVRFQPPIDFVLKPYVQGAIGWHWFFTNTRIEDVELNETLDSWNNNRDSVMGYGAYAGILIAPGKTGPWEYLHFDLRAGYLRNASVEYMRYNEALGDENSYPEDFFERRNSAVDLLGLHFGVTGVF